MLGRRRRKQENIPVLYWFFRNNCVSPSSSRTFRTSSYWSFITDNVLIPNNFFQYMYHVGCAINLHSIISSGLIPGGQSLSNRQTVFSLLVDPMDTNHKDLDVIDLNAPRRAQYLHKAWKRHQVAVDQRPKQNHKDAILPTLPQEPYLLVKEFGLMLNQENIQSPILESRRNWFFIFVMEVYFETMMEAIEFLENQRQSSRTFLVLSSLVWRQVEEKYGRRRKKKIFQYCSDSSGTINSVPQSSPSPFRTQCCWSFITRHCCDSGRFLGVHLSCRMWNQFTFDHQFGILFLEVKIWATDRQYSLHVDPMDKNCKDPDTIDLNAPRRAQDMHEARKKHQNTVYWVDINLAQKNWLKFYQTRSNAIILLETLPAYCIEKAVMMGSGEINIRESFCVTSTTSEDLLKTIGWKNGVQKLLDNQKDKLLDKQKFTNQANQGDPLFAQKTRSVLRDSKNASLEEDANHDRTETPVVCSQTVGSASILNEVDIDLQNIWIATFSCETSRKLSCSWVRQDREPPSSARSSSRSTTKQSLQPGQYDNKANDSGHGQRRAVWAVRDRS